MSNKYLKTVYYNTDKEEEINELRQRLVFGDLLEFDTALTYNHWAIYVGEKEIDGKTVPAVAQSTGRGWSSILGTSSVGQCTCDACLRYNNNAGKAYYESLENVLHHQRKVRINNEMDHCRPPLPPENILERIEAAIEGGSWKEYNVLLNNCQHFVTLCRYGFKFSEQCLNKCTRAVEGIATTISVASNFIPNPAVKVGVMAASGAIVAGSEIAKAIMKKAVVPK